MVFPSDREGRRNLTCQYDGPTPNGTSSQGITEQDSPDEKPGAEHQHVDYATMLFLDPSILQHVRYDVSVPPAPVPRHILDLLEGISELRASASKYFDFIHPWMPLVSKRRFYDLYLQPSFQYRPDIALLLHAIKLLTTLPPTQPRNPRTRLYNAAKHFYLEVEGSNSLSVPVLQAGVLIALYELGQGIYPAAFLSVGACARYAHALGIDTSRTARVPKTLTLVEIEERRRVWWAIVILDRCVLPLFTEAS